MSGATGMKRGVLFLVAEKGINGTVSILLIPVMIQSIGVENYGFWGILLGLVAYIQCLDFGIMYSIERFVAYYSANNDKKSLAEFLSTTLTMLLLISLIILVPLFLWGNAAITYLTKGSIPVNGRTTIFALYPAIMISWLSAVFSGITRGLQRFDISSKIQIVGKLFFAVILIGLLSRERSVYAAIFAFDAQWLLLFCCHFIFSRKLLPGVAFPRIGLSWTMVKRIVNFGFKIQVSAFSSQINLQFDKFLLASFSNLAVVGYYDAASRIVYAIKDIPLFLFSVLIPQVSTLSADGNRKEIHALFQKVTSLLAITGFLIIGLFVLNTEHIIGFVLKKEANDFSVLVFNVLCITMVWQSMAAGAAYVARGMGKTSIEMINGIVVLVVNIVASYSFIRFFDIKGVVFGTALSSVISPTVCYLMVCREFSCGFIPFMFRIFSIPLSGFFIAGGVCWLMKIYLLSTLPRWLNIPITGVVFLGLTHLIYLSCNYQPYKDLLLQAYSLKRRILS